MVYFLFVPGIANGYAFKKGDQNGYGVGEGYGSQQSKGRMRKRGWPALEEWRQMKQIGSLVARLVDSWMI